MGLKVTAIKCSECGDIIYSRCHHDFHRCSCSIEDSSPNYGVTIDGGFEYGHFGWGNKQDKPEPFELELDDSISKRDLYDDWNKRKDKYGKIKTKVRRQSNS